MAKFINGDMSLYLQQWWFAEWKGAVAAAAMVGGWTETVAAVGAANAGRGGGGWR